MSALTIESTEFDTIDWGPNDVLLFAVGYESRSTHLPRKLTSFPGRLVGAAFDQRHVLSYDRNRGWADSQGISVWEGADSGFRRWVRSVLPIGNNCRVGVDISSLSRDRIGVVVFEGLSWLSDIPHSDHREICFFYCPGKFTVEMLSQGSAPLAEAQLLEGYEGMLTDPDLPLTALVGLGLEAGRALGAIELLEPDSVAVLVPEGIDPRFGEAVRDCNRGLLEGRASTAPFVYDLMRPVLLVEELQRRVRGIMRRGRAVFVPLGPKLFALCCCVVSSMECQRIPIWRFTGGQLDEAAECLAAGPVVGLSLVAAGYGEDLWP